MLSELDSANLIIAELRQRLANNLRDRDMLRRDLSNCQCAQFQAERDDARSQLADAIRERDELRKWFGATYCAYCGQSYLMDAPDTTENIGKHIAECPAHPMRRHMKRAAGD